MATNTRTQLAALLKAGRAYARAFERHATTADDDSAALAVRERELEAFAVLYVEALTPEQRRRIVESVR